jgi:hypothetical protein
MNEILGPSRPCFLLKKKVKSEIYIYISAQYMLALPVL